MRTTDGESDKLETLSDDEEITIPSQDRDRKIADKRNIDIRDEQSENTQREDWLPPTEPMHGARPRQTGGERLPAMENPVFRDAAEISTVRRPIGTLLLSPGQRIVMEEEIFTPPRGGGRLAPEPQGVQREVRAVPQIVPEDRSRDDGQGQRNFRSPVEMLVSTVSHMQEDLAILREENRILRTPATSQVTQAPRRAALTMTKVPRFDGTTSW